MKHFLALLGLALPMLGAAQSLSGDKQQNLLGKGHLNVGIHVGQGYQGSYPTTNFVSPSVQYFIADGWSVAVEGRFLNAMSLYDLTYLGGGLSSRYYVLRKKRFAVFGQVGAIYGQSRYHKWEPMDIEASLKAIPNANWQTSAGLGAHYRIGKRWSVEAVAERSWLAATYLTPSYNRWQVSAGIRYWLK